MIINVNLTEYHKETNSLSVDLSILEHNGHNLSQNITVKSYKTGNEINFVLTETKKDASDEDIMGWFYKPADSISAIKKLIIWND